MIQEKGKYLYTSHGTRSGFDACLNDLTLLIQAALYMKRIPIIKKSATSSPHRLDNLNKKAVIDWDEYFDLSKTQIFKIGAGGVIEELPNTLQYIYEQDFDFGSYSNNETRYIDYRQTACYEENDKYPIVCMLNPGVVPEAVEKTSSEALYIGPNSSFLIVFSPSQTVKDLSNLVLGHFGTTTKNMKFLSSILYELPRMKYSDMKFCYTDFNYYACMHVRYEHSAREVSKKINQSSDLRKYVERVCKKVYERNDKNTPLYIMSNIMETHYFDFLRPQYNIYRYTDFEELKRWFSNKQEIDHNLLYVIEQNIFKHAAVRIYSSYRNLFFFEYPWPNIKNIFERIF